MGLTGEATCSGCGQRVLMVYDVKTGKRIALEPHRTDGGWEPKADRAGMVVAQYVAPGEKRERHGHHAHSLRCAQVRSEIAARQKSIDERCTEPVMLPVLTDDGVRDLVRRRDEEALAPC